MCTMVVVQSIMKKLYYLSLLLLVSASATLNAQDSIKWASPNINYMPMGRGFDISYTRVLPTTIESEAEVDRLSDASAEMKSVENVAYDLKFPIIITPRTQFLGSVEYTYDYMRFKDPQNLDYEFYELLNKKELRSRKLKFYVVHGFNEKNYMNIRASAALNGDVNDSDQSIYQFAKYSLSVTYGWQKSETNAYGVGVYMDYTLGRPAIYPVFEWNKSWNERWGFESRLPAKFVVRYMPYDGMRLYGGYDVAGLSYRVVAEVEDSNILKEFEIRRSDVRLMLSLEKRIYDFFWFGIEGGLNYNIRVDASDGDKFYIDKDMITSQLDPSPYIDLSLFILPTEGLKELFGYNH